MLNAGRTCRRRARASTPPRGSPRSWGTDVREAAPRRRTMARTPSTARSTTASNAIRGRLAALPGGDDDAQGRALMTRVAAADAITVGALERSTVGGSASTLSWLTCPSLLSLGGQRLDGAIAVDTVLGGTLNQRTGVVQCIGHRRTIAVAIARILCQCLANHVAQRCGDLGRQRGAGPARGAAPARQLNRARTAARRRASRTGPRQRCRRRWTDLGLPAGLLGRHVAGGASDRGRRCLRGSLGESRHAEIPDLDLLCSGDEDVRGLRCSARSLGRARRRALRRAVRRPRALRGLKRAASQPLGETLPSTSSAT